MRTRLPLVMLLLVGLPAASFGQPGPGDVFREYTCWNEKGDAGGALRVGGKQGEQLPDRGWAHDYINAPVVLPQGFDLEHAIRAEVIVEKILCHDSTTGLAIEVNGHPWIRIPEAEAIPSPQSEYQHHIYPVVPVPLSFLQSGKGNQFRMRVDPEHPWKWPQNLIYGVHFRIYYDAAQKPHPTGKITSLASGAKLGRAVRLEVEARSPAAGIQQVDYIGHYEDVNYEGDGVYTQWHYHFFHGKITNHIGSARELPYRIVWDTSWVPDQKQPMAIAARIIDSAGMIFMTPAVTDLSLERDGWSVELCKPCDIPKKWVTRSGEHEEHFRVTGDLSKAVAARLVWSSWSPGYMRGIFINGTQMFDTEGPKYQYYFHRVAVNDTRMFKSGVNTLTTGRTPLMDGQMVHGMEVNWPGIMVLIQYAGAGGILDGAWLAHKFCQWHPSASVEVADINGDNRPDIVLAPSELAGNWYRLSWFESPADPRQPEWAEHVIVDRIECVIHGLATADFNGDGATDIAASEMHQGEDPDEVAVFINRDAGISWEKQVLSTKGSHCIQAGDIDSDGDIDLVGANWSGPYQPVEMWQDKSGRSR